MEKTPEINSPVAAGDPSAGDASAVEDASGAPANRVYMRAGSFTRSPSKRPKIKKTVLQGAENVSEALTRICNSEVVDLAIVCTARNGHPYHTVRVAARGASEFSATLHIDLQGNVTDQDGNKTNEPFENGGKKGQGSCDFDRALFQVI